MSQLRDLEVKYLGKKGAITGPAKGMRDVPKEETQGWSAGK